MTTVFLILVCLLAAAVFVLLGALVEMYGQLDQVRRHLDMFDSPTPLDLGPSQDRQPSAVGLPAQLDQADHEVVVFLSNKCQTCFQIAERLRGGVLPPSTWLVVVPVSGTASEFVEQFGLTGDRIVLDQDERIVNSLGLEVTPSALTIENGRITRAQTIPTARQLYAVVPSSSPRIVLTPKTSV